MQQLTDEQFQKFADMLNSCEPVNIIGNKELTSKEMRRLEAERKLEWYKMELRVGRIVTESEIANRVLNSK